MNFGKYKNTKEIGKNRALRKWGYNASEKGKTFLILTMEYVYLLKNATGRNRSACIHAKAQPSIIYRLENAVCWHVYKRMAIYWSRSKRGVLRSTRRCAIIRDDGLIGTRRMPNNYTTVGIYVCDRPPPS